MVLEYVVMFCLSHPTLKAPLKGMRALLGLPPRDETSSSSSSSPPPPPQPKKRARRQPATPAACEAMKRSHGPIRSPHLGACRPITPAAQLFDQSDRSQLSTFDTTGQVLRIDRVWGSNGTVLHVAAARAHVG